MHENMSDQRHIIKKQVLEVQTHGRALADKASAQFKQLFSERLLPVVNEVCDRLSPDNRPHRIERLEIDLGPIYVDRRDADLPERFEALLQDALIEAMESTESVLEGPFFEQELTDADSSAAPGRKASPRRPSSAEHDTGQSSAEDRSFFEDTPEGHELTPPQQLKLLTHFLRTGLLPWWADPLDYSLVQQSLETLLQLPADHIRRVATSALADERQRKRLVQSLEEEQLTGLIQAFTGKSEIREAFGQWWELLPDVARLQSTGQQELRAQSTEVLLHFLCTFPAAELTAARLLDHMLHRIASQADDKSLLLDELRRIVRKKGPEKALLNQALSRMQRRLADPDEIPSIKPPPSPEEHQEMIPAEEGSESAPVEIEKTLNPTDRDTPGEAPSPREVTEQSRPPSVFTEPFRNKFGTSSAGDAAPRLVDAEFSSRDSAWKKKKEEKPLATAASSAKKERRRSGQRRHNAYDESETIYLNNAGLVILAPFLPRFFSRLAWLDDEGQMKEEYQHRAALILQYLADSMPEAPEYHLPLNKILAGVPVAEPIDALDPIDEQEQEIGQGLLAAVIGHAAILRDMSVDGFRSTFLQRKGMMTIQGGYWLLRVERETFDIVLDRFPWHFQIVKLPWMTRAVYVEW